MQGLELDSIEDLIRSGNGRQAQHQLKAMVGKKLSREALFRVAGLARRAGLPDLGIRWLNPIVRPAARTPKRATDAETAEYAACLIRIGATSEALDLLSRIDSKRQPEGLLFRAHGLFTEWRNSEAIQPLMAYLRVSGLDPYQRLVGKVNLASALLDAREIRQAEALLAELREETQKFQHLLLLANSFELSAQLEIIKKDWRRAERYLEKAARLIKDQGAIDELFILKWAAIVGLLKRRGKGELARLQEVRNEALTKGHWETLRDCDLFKASALQDEKLLLHVYFGTPFEAYRRRLYQEFGKPVTLPDHYVWSPSGGSGKVWEPFGEHGRLKPGQLLHRLLGALTRDFYRPQRMAALHAAIYPDEFFNPVSSPTRVHQAIRRLRSWLKRHRVALEVNEKDGSYWLASKQGCRIRLPRHSPTETLVDIRLQKLHKRWGEAFFSATEAQRLLKVSARSTSRLLLDAAQDGQLARFGASSATRYRFPPGK